eukprot:TRINITY_DN18560_c0_g1_i1.p2 TRINITY_DN18560_c0_g1~~TRINITY_DN18560_c0_g1_i1.p2  ORF type:complete len:130 (+),score=45.91 TRINITY_DN18560_c0_g1_i1:49-390(+)
MDVKTEINLEAVSLTSSAASFGAVGASSSLDSPVCSWMNKDKDRGSETKEISRGDAFDSTLSATRFAMRQQEDTNEVMQQKGERELHDVVCEQEQQQLVEEGTKDVKIGARGG